MCRNRNCNGDRPHHKNSKHLRDLGDCEQWDDTGECCKCGFENYSSDTAGPRKKHTDTNKKCHWVYVGGCRVATEFWICCECKQQNSELVPNCVNKKGKELCGHPRWHENDAEECISKLVYERWQCREQNCEIWNNIEDAVCRVCERKKLNDRDQYEAYEMLLKRPTHSRSS
jgi:hypothetical protein